ncbi:MAG: FAD-dependent thymidylate synthase [bacterium]
MIEVLDHGFVRLIDHMGSDLSIARSARISHNAEWRAGEDEGSDHRLINYLWNNCHTTPFESVTFTFEVKAPIFVFRQWHRHRTWSFNEVSARYTELPTEFYTPRVEIIGQQSTNNKQGREETFVPLEGRQEEQRQYKATCEHSFKTYERCINAGWPRELARGVLPVATYSHMFATVSLLNLFRFMVLRSDDHAQHEIKVYSDAMGELIREIVPVAYRAFLKG